MSGMDRLTEKKLGMFNHHPDPAIDFCIEVEMLESRLHQAQLGLAKPGDKPEAVEDVYKDICRAMDFTVGGDQGAVAAKGVLRELLAHRRASQAAPSEEWEACTCGPCPLHPAAPAPHDADRAMLIKELSDAARWRRLPDNENHLATAVLFERAVAALSDGLREAVERAAVVAECAFDDRPRDRSGHPSHMDWEDGYLEGTRAAAEAIRAALSASPAQEGGE